MRAMLEELRRDVRPEHRSAVEEELARLDATATSTFGNSPDRDRAGVPDAQGMGGEHRGSALQIWPHEYLR
jgi:hypothetical protein